MQILAEPVAIPGSILDEREIPSDLSLVTPTVVRLAEKLRDSGCIPEDAKVKVQLCLDEAITNAIKHGNKQRFEKKVDITLWRTDGAWGIVISDEGEGFSLESVQLQPAEADLWKESGRGLALLALYMDEVTYYDGGRTLLLMQTISKGNG